MPAEITFSQKRCRTNITGELFFLLSQAGMLELFVQSEIVSLRAAEATRFANKWFLPRMYSQMYHQPGLLTEDFAALITWKSFVMHQVLMLIPQLVGSKR